MRKRRAAAMLFVVLALSIADWNETVQAGQTQDKYRARLATVPVDGGMRNTVAGSGSATAVLAGTRLVISGTFEGLLSPATTASLYRGAAMGVRGVPLAPLAVSKAQKGTLSGSIDLTPEQLESLKSRHLYIQISSEKAPDGNLWGWLVQ